MVRGLSWRLRLALIPALSAGLITAVVLTAPAADAATYRRLINYDGKCLDMTGASRANGVQVQQWTCNGTLRQYWAAINVITPAGIPAVEFKNLNSGKCLTIRNNSTAHGAAVVQQPCRGGANYWQDWYSEDSGNSTYPTVWFVAGDAQPTPPVCCAIHPSSNHTGNGVKMFVNVPNNRHYWWRWGAAH